jgi:hypothetical protein
VFEIKGLANLPAFKVAIAWILEPSATGYANRICTPLPSSFAWLGTRQRGSTVRASSTRSWPISERSSWKQDGAYLDLEGSRVLLARAEAAGEIDHLVGDLGTRALTACRTSAAHDARQPASRMLTFGRCWARKTLPAYCGADPMLDMQ